MRCRAGSWRWVGDGRGRGGGLPAVLVRMVGCHVCYHLPPPPPPCACSNDLYGARDSGCFAWLWGQDVFTFAEVERRLATRNYFDSLTEAP